MTAAAGKPYTLFQRDIIQKLEDRRWFIECIAANFVNLATKWGCSVSLSVRRLGETYDFWREDQGRTISEGIEESESLDHFKHASFIAFWLRRMLPINQTTVVGRNPTQPDESADAGADQKFFLQYGCEICALLIGFQICLFYEVGERSLSGNVEELHDRLARLQSLALPEDVLADFVMFLKHKNMSPGLHPVPQTPS